MSKLIEILNKDEWAVQYDKENNRYRVSYFEDFHFCDEIWFDAYEDKEVDDRIEKIIEKLEHNKEVFKKEFNRKMSIAGFEYYLNLLINWIKEL